MNRKHGTALSIELDPERESLRKERSLFRLHVVLNPTFRLIGFAFIIVAIALHNRFILDSFSSRTFLQVLWIFGLYPIVTWAFLLLFYERWKLLGTTFLVTDIVFLLLAIYYSGGERSWLFFLPLFRVIDQTHTSFRRAMIFGHAAIAGYLGLLLLLASGAGPSFPWPEQLVKAAILYGGILYTAAIARTSDAHKRRTAEAVALARDSIGALQAKSDVLRESRRALKRATQQNALILQSVGEGIVGLDLDGVVTFVNPRAARFVGLPVDDLIGRRAHELTTHTRLDGSLCDGTNCELEQLFRSTLEQAGEHPGFFRHDGSKVPVEYTVAPVFEEGKHTGVVCSFRDITERREMERALLDAKQAAEEASIAKSRFLANMSHELRTPLNAIIGYSEMLQDEARESGNEELLNDLERIRTSGTNLLGLINDILEIAKIEAGRMDLQIEEFELDSLLWDIESTVRPRCEAKGNSFSVDNGGADGSLRTDHLKLRRILLNLLDNANKFTEKGTVGLKVRRTATPSDRILCEVSDTGIGIPQEQLSRLFQSFRQGDPSTTRRHGGTGLGLAIARGLCTMLGGEIEVQSSPSAGTVFTVSIPAAVGRADDATIRSDLSVDSTAQETR